MPEHPRQRQFLEDEVKRRLGKIHKKWRPILLKQMGTPPDPRRIPEETWQALEEEYADSLFWTNTWAYLFSAGALLRQFDFSANLQGRPNEASDDARPGREGLQMPPMDAVGRAAAERWGDESSRELARGIIRGDRKRVESTGSKLDRRRTGQDDSDRDSSDSSSSPIARADKADVDDFLDDITGPDRDERTAATETTRGIAAGERSAAGRIVLPPGELLTSYWRTERDSRVCPICTPLDGQPQEVYGPRVGAPPAHINCRCWLVWKKVSAAA